MQNQLRYNHVKRNLLDESTVERLGEPSTGVWLGAVALEWMLIVAALWVCAQSPVWWVWTLGFFFIGTRQHALGVLAHEGAHFSVARSSFWNDVLTNLFASYPLTFPIQGFRPTHLQHHWYLETPDDPSKVTIERHAHDWTFPMPRWDLLVIVLRDLTLLSQRSSATLLKYLWHVPGGRTRHLFAVLLMQASAFALAIWLHHPWVYLLLWLLPLFTVTSAIYRIRAISEHSGFGGQENRYARETVDPLTTTRTTTMGAAARFLFAPYNISYHIEHHLFPSVPVFRLRSVHDRLRANPDYQQNAHVTPGHGSLIRELTKASPT